MKKPNHGILRGLASFGKKAETKEKKAFEGKFGRLFPTLKPAEFSDEALKKLANEMIHSEDSVTPETEPDGEENSAIAAGYTYLGQFIDHDITFDPVGSFQARNDASAIVDFRTPKLDLDNVYGRGPSDQPYLYDADGIKFLLGSKINGSDSDPNTHDLPRSTPVRGSKRALIGDPRNDENIIVSQLQGIFLRFHNSVVDYLKSLGKNETNTPNFFETVQDLVRWHYQWVVINDFLPTIIRKEVIEEILPHLKHPDKTIHDFKPSLRILKADKTKEAFIPIEFSVAAYRFGHSMIRPIYRINRHSERKFIFPDMVGFDAVADNLAIDWTLFFDFTGKNKLTETGVSRVQPAYKIDTALVDPLKNLPPSIATHVPSLALRNLLRGKSLGLPSGQAVADFLKIPRISNNDLKVGKAQKPDPGQIIKSIEEVDPSFKDNAPLWFYILAEALFDFNSKNNPIDNTKPVRLGTLGGTLVGEVFVWLLLSDEESVFYGKVEDENKKLVPFTPIKDFQKDGKFGITELITQAQKA